MSNTAIRVDNLSKLYQLGAGLPQHGLRELIQQRAEAIWGGLTGRGERRGSLSGGSKEDFWALKDVSFEVTRGEVVGVIGRNGAGKSTLLKILSRITEPTSGRVEIHGRVGSLLEVGTGFHPELTGRENIFLNGAILGMSQSEIRSKLEAIVEFSGIGRFLETPVKRYSSGMYVRLAFAVAAHLQPEILIVDEVLAVGDAEFQKKCLGKMQDVAEAGRTVLFVSHNLAAVSRLCQRAIWLDQGRLVRAGSTHSILDDYLNQQPQSAGSIAWQEGYSNPGVHEFQFLSASLINARGKTTQFLARHESFTVEFRYRFHEPVSNCRIGIMVSNSQNLTAFESYDNVSLELKGVRKAGEYVAKCTIPGGLLNVGRFYISLNSGVPNQKNFAWAPQVLSLTIEELRGDEQGMIVPHEGVVRPTLDWETTFSEGTA